MTCVDGDGIWMATSREAQPDMRNERLQVFATFFLRGVVIQGLADRLSRLVQLQLDFFDHLEELVARAALHHVFGERLGPVNGLVIKDHPIEGAGHGVEPAVG